MKNKNQNPVFLHGNPHIGLLNPVNDEESLLDIDFDAEQSKIEKTLANAINRQANLEKKKVEAENLRRALMLDERDSHLMDAERFRKQALEAGISQEEAKRRLDWADEKQQMANEISAEFDPQPLVQEVEAPKKKFYQRHNFWVAFVSLLCVGIFFVAMTLIKSSDPEAAVFDATAYQKFFLVASLFSALQLVKRFALRVFYPIIYDFQNDESHPDFDYGSLFKNRLKPFEQICVATFLICWFSLEFILLYSVKF
jgi:hypothetical protein